MKRVRPRRRWLQQDSAGWSGSALNRWFHSLFGKGRLRRKAPPVGSEARSLSGGIEPLEPRQLLATTVLLGEVLQISDTTQITTLDDPASVDYAINFTSDTNQGPLDIRGVSFMPDHGGVAGAGVMTPAAGVTTYSSNEANNWKNLNILSGPDAGNLQTIMHDIRWSATPNRLEAHLDVTAGTEYTLQILFDDNGAENRNWDIMVDGARAVDEITSQGVSGTAATAGAISAYSYTFVARDDKLEVVMGDIFESDGDPADTGGDRNAIWQGLVLARTGKTDIPLTGGGPGGLGGTDALSHLQLWLDGGDISTMYQDVAMTNPVTADGQPIAGWADKSGNSFDAQNLGTNGAIAPLYEATAFNGSLPSVRFDNNNSGLTIDPAEDFQNANNNTGHNHNYTVIIVDQYWGAAQGRTLQGRDTNWLIGKHGGQNRYYAEGWVYQPNVAAGINNPVISVGTGRSVFNGADPNSSYHLNGSSVTGVAQGAASGVPNGNPRRMGFGRAGASNEQSEADVGEVIIYDRELTVAERLIVENYLSTKWGIGLNTAGGAVDIYDETASGGRGMDLVGVGQVAGNVALGKAASQSGESAGGHHARAVDGNTNGQWAANSTTHTNDVANSWWQVDLWNDHDLEEITLHNRADCCGNRLSNFRVSVLDDGGEVWGNNYFAAGAVPQGGAFTLPDFPGATGDTIRVQLNGLNNDTGGRGVLSLAEVEVLSPVAVTTAGAAGFGIEASGLENGDFIAAAHAVDTNSKTTAGNLPATVDARWDRTWWVDVTDANDSVSGTLSFDYSDSGLTRTNEDIFTLLKSTDGGANWTALGSTTTVVEGDKVRFTVSAGDLDDALYTIGDKSSIPPDVNTSAGEPLYEINAGPQAVDAGITLSDPDSANMVSATVTISPVVTGDVLTYTGPPSATWDAGSSTLTFDPGTLAEYQTALSQVSFETTAADLTPRTITFTVADDAGKQDSASRTLLPVSSLGSTTYEWDGGAPTNDYWMDPENWSSDVVPDRNDLAVFPSALDLGLVPIQFDFGANVGSGAVGPAHPDASTPGGEGTMLDTQSHWNRLSGDDPTTDGTDETFIPAPGSLVYADNTAAAGVSISFGSGGSVRTGNATTVDWSLAPFSGSTLLATPLDNPVMNDYIHAALDNVNFSFFDEIVGVKIEGLVPDTIDTPVTFQVYVVSDDSTSEDVSIHAGTVADGDTNPTDFSAFTPVELTGGNAVGDPDPWELGTNYVRIPVTLTKNDTLVLAGQYESFGGDFGILNSIQIVPRAAAGGIGNGRCQRPDDHGRRHAVRE